MGTTGTTGVSTGIGWVGVRVMERGSAGLKLGTRCFPEWSSRSPGCFLLRHSSDMFVVPSVVVVPISAGAGEGLLCDYRSVGAIFPES